MKLFSSALAIGLLALSGVSHVAITAWDEHDDVEFGFGFGAGAFSDVFTFTLPSMGEISSSAISSVLKPKVGVFWGDVKLYSGAYGGPASLVGGYTFGPTTALNYYTAPGLAAGEYFYMVSGTYAGKGSYALDSSFTSTAVPVPEPETYALLALGLGCIAVARRSRAIS